MWSSVAAATCSAQAPPTPSPSSDIPEGTIQDIYEEALSVVGRAAGLSTRPNISRAKEILRNLPGDPGGAGAQFASKFSRLSSLRNTAVHESTGRTLLRELEVFLSRGEAFKATDDTNSVADTVDPFTDGDLALQAEHKAAGILAQESPD